jgi:putative Holliday junction resolvase
MGKVLGIDFGMKRCGIAITDELKIIASPLETVDSKIIITYLKQIVLKENIEKIVLGEPKRLNNEDSQTTLYVRQFAEKLKELFPHLAIQLVDERLTSKMAQHTLINSGLNKKQRRDKSRLDTISATLILQTYLQSI